MDKTITGCYIIFINLIVTANRRIEIQKEEKIAAEKRAVVAEKNAEIQKEERIAADKRAEIQKKERIAADKRADKEAEEKAALLKKYEALEKELEQYKQVQDSDNE